MFGNSQKENGINGQHSSNGGPLIDLRNVVKNYATEAGQYTALRGVNLQVGAGEFVAVVGKSGSGKTTLINMITGIDRPSTGTIHVGGTAIHDLSEGKLAKWRGRNMGVIFQFFQLLPTLTALENVMLPMAFCKLYSRSERRDRAMNLLQQVGMEDHVHKLPSAISGGQQQRVAIARSLATDPSVLIADEPTGNLDSKTAEDIFQLFENLVANGRTIMMVTHDVDLANRVTRSLTMADGQIVEQKINDRQLIHTPSTVAVPAAVQIQTPIPAAVPSL